jgi:hypothetical protein
VRGQEQENALLELSDERDRWERLCAAAYREGWQAAEQARADDYGTGYYDGILGRKRFEHQLAQEAELELLRWGPGGPEHFGDLRPGDWPGGVEGLARVRAAWLAEGLGLGPGPGWVHLSGPVVHWHKPCTSACYAYKPGWHTIVDAIAILSTLPGEYAEAIATLREQADEFTEGSAAA